MENKMYKVEDHNGGFLVTDGKKNAGLYDDKVTAQHKADRLNKIASDNDAAREKLKGSSFSNGRARGLTVIQNKLEKVGIKLSGK
jgi:hypothetical protein